MICHNLGLYLMSTFNCNLRFYLVFNFVYEFFLHCCFNASRSENRKIENWYCNLYEIALELLFSPRFQEPFYLICYPKTKISHDKKVQICWEGHKDLKKISHFVISKTVGDCSNFVDSHNIWTLLMYKVFGYEYNKALNPCNFRKMASTHSVASL